jgi:hypothetical protein
MPAKSEAFAAHRGYRVTIDIKACLAAAPSDDLRPWPGSATHHAALVGHLLDRPDILGRLLRGAATAALARAAASFHADETASGTADSLLGPLVADLSPAARRHFTEDLEDGAAALYFDGVVARVTDIRMDELGDGRAPIGGNDPSRHDVGDRP